jgi:two-component system, LuxR family, response regulator FixJ
MAVLTMNSQTRNVPSTDANPLQGNGGVCRTIYIVDEDPAVHQALSRLFHRQKYTVVPYASAASLLASIGEAATGVLILDLETGDMSGLELQDELRKRNIGLKIIFLSGQGNVEKSVQAIKGGAIDFLEKPYRNRQLLNSIEVAFQVANAEEEQRLHREAVQQKYARLTPREREVMNYIVTGISNRDLAQSLGLSSRTVEIHRAKIMAKMEAASLPELVRMVHLLSNHRPEEVLANGSSPLPPG